MGAGYQFRVKCYIEYTGKKGVGGRRLQSAERKFHVSLGMGEMKRETGELKGIKVWCRMTIKGNDHERATDSKKKKKKTENGWKRVRHHPVPVPLARQHP